MTDVDEDVEMLFFPLLVALFRVLSSEVKHRPHGLLHVGDSCDVALITHINIILPGNVTYQHRHAVQESLHLLHNRSIAEQIFCNTTGMSF